MRPLLLLPALLLAAPLAILATPLAAQEAVRLPDGSMVTRTAYADLKTPGGRAKLHQSLQQAAQKVCADVRPLRDRSSCEQQVVADAEARALPPVARQLRLARQEAETTQLAAR